MRKTVCTLILLGLALSLTLLGCRPPEVEGVVINIDRGLYDKALEVAQQAIEKYPNNAEAWFYYGWLQGKKGNFEEMSKAYDKALALNPDMPVKLEGKKLPAKMAIEDTRMRFYAESYNSGVQIYNKALQTDDPEQRKALLEQARQKFLAAKTIYPTRTDYYRPLAVTYLQLGDTTQAENLFMASLDAQPDNDSLVVLVGDFFLQAGKLDKATELYNRALKINPNNVEAYISLGELEAKRQNWDKSVQYFAKASELAPKNAAVAFNVAVSFYNQERYEEAIPYFQKVLKLEPDNEQATGLLAVCYLQTKKYQEAQTLLEEATQKHPDNVDYWNYLAIAYANQNMKDKAEAALRKVKELKGEL